MVCSPRHSLLASVLLLVAAVGLLARPKVLVISIDGLRPDALLAAQTPAVKAIIARGAWTMKACTIIPSITLPAHTSMTTGVGPMKHKVLWNSYIPRLGVVRVPTMFELAHRRGLTTGLFAGKDKFRHLDRPGSLDVMAIPGYPAQTVARAAVSFILTNAPDLLFVHLADPDGAGHQHGWMSPQQMAAIATADAAVATLLAAYRTAGLADRTVVIVTSDHGGKGRSHGIPRAENLTIPWIIAGPGIGAGRTLETRVRTMDTAATALHLLGVPIPASFDGKPVTEAIGTAPSGRFVPDPEARSSVLDRPAPDAHALLPGLAAP